MAHNEDSVYLENRAVSSLTLPGNLLWSAGERRWMTSPLPNNIAVYSSGLPLVQQMLSQIRETDFFFFLASLNSWARCISALTAIMEGRHYSTYPVFRASSLPLQSGARTNSCLFRYIKPESDESQRRSQEELLLRFKVKQGMSA